MSCTQHAEGLMLRATWGLGLALGALAACGLPDAYECQSSLECVQPGSAPGTCEAIGYCSFPDNGCASGQRFGDFAGGFGGKCVSPDGATVSEPLETDGDTETDGGGTSAASGLGESGEGSDSGVSTAATFTSAGPTSATMTTTASTATATDGSGEETGMDTDDSASDTTDDPLDADLVLWIDFDDGAVDLSEYAHEVVCGGGCPGEVSGQFGSAGTFSSGSHLQIPAHPGFDLSGSFTLTMWARVDGAPSFGRGTLFSQVYPGEMSYDVSVQDLDGDTTYDFVAAAEGSGSGSLDRFVVGQWRFVAIRVTPGMHQVFLDGTQIVNGATMQISAQDTPLFIGGIEGALHFGFNGAIDDVRLYKRVLDDGELMTVQSGAPLE
ncbi:MAG: LamG domain-containing protein [Myxococcota bacterium]